MYCNECASPILVKTCRYCEMKKQNAELQKQIADMNEWFEESENKILDLEVEVARLCGKWPTNSGEREVAMRDEIKKLQGRLDAVEKWKKSWTIECDCAELIWADDGASDEETIICKVCELDKILQPLVADEAGKGKSDGD